MEEIEFNTYVLPLRDRMFRYAQSLLLSAAEAEDAVADLLERLWVERSRLAGCRNIDSFVLTALRNRCYDLLRSRRARSRRDDAFGEGIERATMGESGVWEIREQVRRAIASLPERQREAVHLHYSLFIIIYYFFQQTDLSRHCHPTFCQLQLVI